MSKPTDLTRRSLLKLSLASSVTLFLASKEAQARPAANTRNQILSIRSWPSDVYSRLIIEGSQAIKAKYFRLNDPERLVIDIENSELVSQLEKSSPNDLNNDPLINNLKIGQFSKDTVRIVLGIKSGVMIQTQNLTPVDFSGITYQYRYIFDIYPEKPSIKKQVAMNNDTLAALQLDELLNTPKSATAKQRRTQEQPVLEEGNILSIHNKGKFLIMLDPGHGGEDPGAVGPSNLREKDVVLDVAKRLSRLIENNPKLDAELTRDQDIFIPLGTRVAMARKIKADLFISLHADGFTSASARGSSVFMLSEKGASSSFARALATSQNNSDKIGGLSFQTKDPVVNRILLDMTQSMTLNKSHGLGNHVLQELGKINKLHNHKVERASFAVLKAPDIPSILVETAFISNPEEERKLASNDFKDELAERIYNGINKFITSNYKL